VFVAVKCSRAWNFAVALEGVVAVTAICGRHYRLKLLISSRVNIEKSALGAVPTDIPFKLARLEVRRGCNRVKIEAAISSSGCCHEHRRWCQHKIDDAWRY